MKATEKMKTLLVILFATISMVCNAQRTFKAVSATINDGSGYHTMTTFETSAMTVTDYNSYVTISWGGSSVTLQKNSSTTYFASAKLKGQNISLTAYKTSGTISSVKVCQNNDYQSVNILFKPSTTSNGSLYGRTIDICSNTIETSYHAWYATKIQINTNSTVVTKVCRPKQAKTWIHSDRTEYIEDCDTGTRYYIRSSSIAMSPEKTILMSTTPKVFTETYGSLPSYVKRINICSGSSYYVRGLKIR